jgi:hypothetical protein
MADEIIDEQEPEQYAQAMDEGMPDPADAPAKPIELPEDAVNLVPVLLEMGKTDKKIDEFVRKDLPKQIVDEFDEDWKSRESWFEKRAEEMKLFLGQLDDKEEPFKNCANMHVPVIQERILRLVHRTYAELFRDRMPMFEAIPMSDDPADKERARLVELHQNWQFQKEVRGFKQYVRRALLEFYNHGECVFQSYRDFEDDVNAHEFLSSSDFVYPYTSTPPLVDMSDVPRKTKILRKYKRQLRKMQRLGIWAQVDDVIKQNKEGSFDDEIEKKTREVVDAYEGKDKSEARNDAPYALLEYHGWTTLPGQEDETPIRAVVDYRTKTLLALFKREYDDPDDRIRFDRESQEYAQYLADTKLYAEGLMREQRLLQQLQQPGVDPVESQLVAEQVQRQSPPQPAPPRWIEYDDDGIPKPPKPCRQKTIEQFSHAACIENPQGSHGLGIGQALMPYQRAANILLNQFVDAGTLANSTTGFLHEAVRLPPGVKTISPNHFHRIRGIPIDMMEKAIFRLKADQANPQLLAAIDKQIEAADGVASAPDVLSGEREAQETFRGQAGRLEQAVRQLTVFATNFVEMFGNVVKNNALLNFQHLNELKTLVVVEPRYQQGQKITVGRELYRDDYHILFTADLRFTSQAQRIAEKDDILGMLTKGIPPQLASIIFKPQMFAAVARECLTVRSAQNLLQYVLTDEEIAQKLAAPPPMPGGPQPGQPAGPGGPVPTAIPTGQTNKAPGAQPPQTRVQQGVPVEAAPSK